MNDNNKKFSFRELYLNKIVRRIGSLFMAVATLFLSCGSNSLVVRAEETQGTVKMRCEYDRDEEYHRIYDLSIDVPVGWELVGSLSGTSSGKYYSINLYMVKGKSFKQVEDVIGDYYTDLTHIEYEDGYTYTNQEKNKTIFPYQGSAPGFYVNISFTILSGSMKVFASSDDFDEYVASGGGQYTIIKPDELDKGWYLKNIQYEVTADDSPSSEAGEDATYIHFSWDIDNLENGDLLEIKTYNYYTKIGGDKMIGFHDYITKGNSVSAYSGAYSFSQYEATKAWFNSLENKPSIFKNYETTDYYLRPYRQGQYGGWVHVKMGRSTPTSSPYVEDVEYGDFDEENNWIVDESTTNENGGHHGIDQGGSYISPDDVDDPFIGTNITGMFSYFYDFMKSIPSMLGDLPALVSSIISFLPSPIIGFIGVAIIVVIILRIVGR